MRPTPYRFVRLAIIPGAVFATAAIHARPLQEPAQVRPPLEEALQRYEAITARGGWPVVPEGPRLELGSREQRTITLRARLTAEGYSVPPSAEPEVYDSITTATVRSFQALHGLEEDGIVGPATLAALNVPAERRARQIATNLERRRDGPAPLEERYLLVNSAAFTLILVDRGRTLLRLRTIVGRADRPTPAVSTSLTDLVFRPLWRIPQSIVVPELRDLVRRDSTYLEDGDIRVFRDSAGGDEVDRTGVDWTSDNAWNQGYQFVQEPGSKNPLGGVKFVIHTPFSVYLHDTPARALFHRRVRTLSHGCVRVEQPELLVAYLLPEWTTASIRSAMTNGREQRVPVPEPIPVYVVYWTAWSEGAGPVAFRDDLYHLDGP